MSCKPCIRQAGRRQYCGIQKHHRTSTDRNASKWVDCPIECRTFDAADFGSLDAIDHGGPSWIDVEGNLWGVLLGKPKVGINGEQFGFFWAETNPNPQYHGFPLFPFANGCKPIPDVVFNIWERLGLISRDDIPTMIKKKKI